MFSYYGSKSKIIHYYPHPKFKRIIEPFAGSARYACMYYARDIWINDKYEVVYSIWKWIQQATRDDIARLPVIGKGEDLRDIKSLTQEERWLLGYLVNPGNSSPCNIVTGRADGWGKGHDINGRTNAIVIFKQNILRIIGKIDHWRITQRDYQKLPNLEATWFIDPPYQFGGQTYIVNDIDFKSLLRWIKNRRGETLTCENTKNTWLDRYKILKRIQGSQQTHTVEVLRYGYSRTPRR